MRPRVGDTRALVVSEEITRTQVVQYAGASGDFSVLHTDEPHAVAAGHPSIMAHGMLTMALSSRVVTTWFGTENLRTLGVRFTAPVWPGDRLTSSATIVEMVEGNEDVAVRLALRTTNDSGLLVLAGEAIVTVSGEDAQHG
jgi:acyl dehydratase